MGDPRTVPMTARDAAMTGTWIVILFEHLVLPSRAELVAGLETVARADPLRRVVARDTGRGSWDVAADAVLRSRCEDAVRELAGHTAHDPAALIAAVRASGPSGPPVQFVVVGDALVQLVDHRLCDGLLASQLLPLLMAACGGHPAPSPFGAGQSRRPLRAALRATFDSASDVRALLDDRRGDAARREASAVRPAQPLPALTTDAPAATAAASPQISRYARISPERYRELRRWQRDADAAPVVVEGELARTALRDEGVACDDDLTILVDLRRYLPDGTHTLGNFVVGQPIPARGGVAAMSARLREALSVGRPLAAAAAGTVAALVGRLAPARRTASSPDDRVAFAVSSMGLLRGFERLPWAVPPDQQSIRVYVDTGARRAATALTLVSNGALHLTITFDPAHVATERVDAALHRIAADPVAVLAGTRVG